MSQTNKRTSDMSKASPKTEALVLATTTILEDYFKYTTELRPDEDIASASKALLTAFADTLEAVIAELPEKKDMERYEDMTTEGGLNIMVDESNMAVTGNNLAHLAQFSDDKGFNEAIDQTHTVLQTLVEGLRNG